MPLADISANGSQVAYFLLKASGASSAAQTHNVAIYDRRPDLSGAVSLLSCTYTFLNVSETIKASANKVENNGATADGAISVSNSSPKLGEEIVISVEGFSGKVGQGNATDGSIVWLTPAAVSSWPTSAFRLTKVELYKSTASASGWPLTPNYTDQLLISSASTVFTGNGDYYLAKYFFKVIGKPASTVKVVPVAQISSGTQIKHSDTTSTGSTADLSFSSFSIPQTLAKTVTATSGLQTGTVSTISGARPGVTYVAVPYKLEVAQSAGSPAAIIDEIVDTPGTGAIYYDGSGSVTDNSGTRTIEAVYAADEANISPRPYHFVGPFSLTSSVKVTITYKMWLPIGGTYVNNAYALVGNQSIGASATTNPNVTVDTSSGGTGSVGATDGTTSNAVTAVTDPATSVTSTNAVMNATVDPNGTATTIKFQYGTSPSLSSIINTLTATTPASGSSSSNDPISAQYSLTGLTQGTTYYYRVVVYSSTGSVLAQGDITSFTTLVVASTPTVSTLPASNITSTGATLNGNISPNNTLVTKIVFEWDSGATFSGSTNYEVLKDDSNADIQTSGTDTQTFSKDLTGLSAGTYSYRIIACTGSTSGSNPCGNSGTSIVGSIVVFDLSKQSQTINFSTISNRTYGDSNFSESVNASSNLEVNVTSLTTDVCSITTTFASPNTTITITIKKVGDCILDATQSGNTTYNAAVSVQQTFNIAPAILTVTADDKSKTAGGSDPSFTSTLSGLKTANGATDAATVTSAVYTFSGKSGYSYAPSTTTPTNAGIYSNEPSSAVLNFTTGSASNYIVQYVAGTYTINAASKSNQTIVMDDYSTLLVGSTINLDTLISNAGTGTGLISYVVTSGNCTISGSTLTAVSGSSCVVTSTKAGDASTNEATDTATINLASPYTVTFDANGGTGSASVSSATQATVGGSVTLATVGSLAKDYSGFMGWGMPASGGTFSAAGSTYTPASSLTLYAQWITTGSSSNVARTTADVAGTSSLALTNPKFCYSSTNPGSSFDATTCTSTAASETYSAYSASLTSLTANTTYYYQITGTLGAATSYYGTVRTFTTLAYSITINSATGGSGTTSAAAVASGGSVTLTATPTSGYAFSSWSCTGGGSLNSSTANPATLSNITSNATCTPVFVATFTVTINSATGGSATTSAATVNSGGSVTLTATATSGYVFSSWSCTGGGSLNSSTANPATLSNITANATCTPVFTATYTVTVGTLTNASGSTISIATSPAIAGATITLTVNPSAGLQLKSGTLTATPTSGSNPSISGSGPYTFTMPASNVVITAEFESIPAGSFSVTIASVTGGTGATSSAVVVSGGSVTLSATPSSGYKFVSWSCDGGSLSNASISGPTLSNITANVTCTPTFALLTLYTVTFNANGGSGSPSVSSVTQVAENGSVTLASVGSLTLSNSGFIGWGTSSSGGTFSNAGASYTPASSLTLYAQWVTTTAATSVASTTASLNGSATLVLTDPKFCYSTTAPATNFDPTTCSPVSATGTYTVAVTGLTASTTYYFQLFGTVSGSNYFGEVLNFTTSAAASTYSITVSSGTGGSGSSSAATVTSGGSVTLTATPASGYSFAGWSCSGGGTLNNTSANPATLSNIAANATCTATFTRNSGGGGVGPGNTNTGTNSNQNLKIIVQKVSTGSSNPNRTGSSTPSPSQPVTTTVTTTVVTQDGSKVTTTTTGITNSSASATGSTNSSGGSINALTNTVESAERAVNGAKVEAVETSLETKMVVDENVPPSVLVNRGQDNKVQVQAVNGWTGRVSVAVVNENDPNDVKSYLEVVINPLPVTNVSIELPERGKKPEISFDPSPSQVIEYEIQVNGKTVCTGTETSCQLPRLIGPKSQVDIIARGQDDTTAVTRLPGLTPPAPIPALTVYFPLASSQLTRSEIKKLDRFVREVRAAGFTRVVLEGHTDVQGARTGYNNLALSNSRAKATADYLRKFLKVKFAKDQFAETRPAVEGSGEVVYQNNRRTEVSVW